jgi:hypothetical protein
MGKGFAGEEEFAVAPAGFAVGFTIGTVEPVSDAPTAPAGGAAVVPPVEAVMVMIWTWPPAVNELSDDTVGKAAIAAVRTVEMLVTVVPSTVRTAVVTGVVTGVVATTGGVVKVDVVETIIYVEVTPQSNSDRYPAAP